MKNCKTTTTRVVPVALIVLVLTGCGGSSTAAISKDRDPSRATVGNTYTTGSSFSATSSSTGDQMGNAVQFIARTIANGKVYIGTRGNNTGGAHGSTGASGELDVYGLKS